MKRMLLRKFAICDCVNQYSLTGLNLGLDIAAATLSHPLIMQQLPTLHDLHFVA